MNSLAKTETFSLTPRNFDEAMRYAEMMASSALVPKAFQGRPGDVLVAIQMGFELRLPPMAALQNIAVINGRPSLWGDAVLAVCKGHPDFANIREWHEGETAFCEVERRGQSTVTQSFSTEDAKKAGLYGKSGPWTQYPKRMRQMRARGFALRDAFPDALRGINIAEEVRDLPTSRPPHDDDTVTVEAEEGRAGTRTERLKANTADAQMSNELFAVLAAIHAAVTLDELKAVASVADELDAEEKEHARNAFKKKRAELSEAGGADE